MFSKYSTDHNAWNDMFIHGKHSLIFVIRNKIFLILNAYIFAIFSTIFLLNRMTHNASHLLKFKKVYTNKKIIKLKKTHVLVA
jgi:hypothetical protein